MTALRLLLLSGATFIAAMTWQQMRAQGVDRTLQQVQRLSGIGALAATFWLVVRQPFWRGVFLTFTVMTFFAFLFPAESEVLAKHQTLMVAVPFAAGFASANYGRGPLGTLATFIVLAILGIAIVKELAPAEPGAWRRYGGTISSDKARKSAQESSLVLADVSDAANNSDDGRRMQQDEMAARRARSF